ncbi:DUF1772 domain-containing protein [Candidatus Nitrosocosmicus hydrocola]|uniref:DUF1772 domain-containing protein n=1 Tax=Candidatus Nitrosocosmicus hydrocola TaxID=1826872 RepID=UPI0011E5FE80|nr:DUF1772 domain-containing protein [Candidatus Nitrosocosmicus hydrocola]
MNKLSVVLIVVIVFVWLLIISFGASIFEAFIIYPNIFYDVPTSLETSVEFMAIYEPIDFFPPLGLVTLLIGIIVSILTWKLKFATYWLIGSPIIILVGELLFSATFFWPKNTIMFSEGITLHSVENLRVTAQDFQTGQLLRLSMNGVAAIMSFIGMLNFHRAILAKNQLDAK